MSIKLRARSPLKKKGLFFASAITVEQVTTAIISAAKGSPLAGLTMSAKLRDGVSIMLHPAGADLTVRADGEDVVVEAETSLIGPGYHAFLVSALDVAQSALGLRWAWDDESDYAENRDFHRLQAAMAKVLRQLIETITTGEVGDGTGLKILMPYDFRAVPEPGEVFTPLGPTTLDRLRACLAEADADFRAEAEAIYVWWGQGFDGTFFRGIALYSLWNEVRWATPLHREEAESIARTFNWCIEAAKLDADLPITNATMKELRGLVESNDIIPVAREQGIGYRRRTWNRPFYHWQLSMPGSLAPTIQRTEKGATFVFRAPDLDIRATTYTVPSNDAALRAREFHGEIAVTESQVEGRTVTTLSLGKTFALGANTAACLVTIASSNPEMLELGMRVGTSLTYNSAE
jgi:hypothetical protein